MKDMPVGAFGLLRNKMKKIKIKGGLGNQMFQYSYGMRLMLIEKKDVIFDTSFYNYNEIDTYRPFLLSKFNIDSSTKFKNIKENLLIKVFNKIKSKVTDNYGFYQSEKYFKEIEAVIRKEFKLKDPLGITSQEYTDKILGTKNSVSIHIRRGDYALDTKTNKHHGVCSLDYYQNAIKHINEKVESPTFFIFSDDIEWVKENLKINDAIYVSNPEIKDYEELILMSTCKHNVIANSSFSWWGAWLNQNPDKIVIAPKQWTANKTADELDILPKTWIQI